MRFGMLYNDDTTCHKECVNPEGTCSSHEVPVWLQNLSEDGAWGLGQALNSLEADSGAGYWGSGGRECRIAELQTLESEGEVAGECHRQAAGLT